MSRFAVVHEDPNYDEPEDIMEWLEKEIDSPSVVKEPQPNLEDTYYGA